MGYGSYQASDWEKLKTSKKLTNTQTVHEVFKRSKCNPKMDPQFIGTRECFDSADHPNTTPIVVGLDVTASMGYLAVKVATEALNELITKLYSTGAIEDPALMCAAYGDSGDASPLQVTQFESDIRIAEQLLDIYFENGGQGQVVPTCLWYFLARHTNIDAIRKRNRKGFVFTVGDDAAIRNGGTADTVHRVINDPLDRSLTKAGILGEVQQTFNAYHIVLGHATTEEYIKGHTVFLDRDALDSLPEIIISIIQRQNGTSQDKVIAQWDEIKQPVVAGAISQIGFVDESSAISL